MKRANWSFVSRGDWIAAIVLLMLSTSATSRGQESNNTLDAADGTPQNAVYVDTAGDVGVGTETPVELLSVAGTLGLYGKLRFLNAAGGGSSDDYFLIKHEESFDNNTLRLYLHDNSGERLEIWGNTCATEGGCGSNPERSHFFQVNGRAYHKGYLGIGTTSAASRLTVTQNGFSGNLDWTVAIDSATSDSSSASLHLRDAAADSVLLARGDGRIGIGTEYPGERLSVNGIVESTSGGVRFPDGSLQTTAATFNPGGVDSVNQLDGDVSIIAGTSNIQVTSAPGNAIAIAQPFNAGLDHIAPLQSHSTEVDTGLGVAPRVIRLTLGNVFGQFSQCEWLDPDGDEDGVTTVVYLDYLGNMRTYINEDSDMVGRIQTGASDSWKFIVEMLSPGTFRITAAVEYGDPTALPSIVQFTWFAE